MLYLLDDSDDRVVKEIEDRIRSFGRAVVPILEQAWPDESNPIRVDRILNLIKEINSNVLSDELRRWKEEHSNDLLQGMLIVNKLQNPLLDRQIIENHLDKIKLDAWLELKYDLTAFEKIKILNYVFFDLHKFKGDTDNYHSSANSFIAEVLEKRKGNPVTLAVIYALVAQRLNIPVYGVNLPQHFVLGYVNNLDWSPIERINEKPQEMGNHGGLDVMFYINPFNNGLIFSRENIVQFLQQLNLESKPNYFKTCDNIEILKRVLRNLTSSYEKENKDQKVSIVKRLMDILDEP